MEDNISTNSSSDSESNEEDLDDMISDQTQEVLREVEQLVLGENINNINNINNNINNNNNNDNKIPENLNKIDPKSIFIGNVDYNGTPNELEDVFQDCGEIVKVTIPKDKYFKQPKGFAYMQFTQEQSVQNAIRLDGVYFKGRKISVMPKRFNVPGVSSTDRPPQGSNARRSGIISGFIQKRKRKNLSNLTGVNLKSILKTIIPKLQQISENLAERNEDNAGISEETIRIARLNENADHLKNQIRANFVTVTGLQTYTTCPEDAARRTEFLLGKVKPLLSEAFGDGFNGVVVDDPIPFSNDWLRKIPDFDLRFKNVEDANKFLTLGNQNIDSDFHLDEGKLTTSVTVGTKVRMEILIALARVLTTGCQEAAACLEDGHRPVLRVKLGLVETSYYFVEAVLKFKVELATVDLSRAYLLAGRNFAGCLQENFLVLKDE